MLNRSQIRMLLMIRNRANNLNNVNYSLLSHLPTEIIREISEFGQDPKSDFAKALHMTAYGDLEALKEKLAAASNSPDKAKLKELLLSTGTAITPAGITIKLNLLHFSRHTEQVIINQE